MDTLHSKEKWRGSGSVIVYLRFLFFKKKKKVRPLPSIRSIWSALVHYFTSVCFGSFGPIRSTLVHCFHFGPYDAIYIGPIRSILIYIGPFSPLQFISVQKFIFSVLDSKYKFFSLNLWVKKFEILFYLGQTH